jgi:glucosamine-6-phosphate deaminase
LIQLAIFEDYQTLSRQAAIYIADRIKQKPNTILGLATGSTPLGLYKELVSMYEANKVNFSEVVTFNLDEYVGLPKEHPQSYYFFMQKHLFSKVNIKPKNIHFPEGLFNKPTHACHVYEQQLLERGPIDLQILGIGSNGHIGFNEPADRMTLQTHITDLADRTIVDNARFFKNETEVPRKAITMGIGSIMKAKTILLLANNETKTAALNAMFSGVVDPNIPASILQLHENVLVFVSSDIAKHLKYRPTALMNK